MKLQPATILSFTILLALASGCASTGATGRKGATSITMPASGKSKVVFVRPGRLATAITFEVHDQEKLIGVLPYNSYCVYECEPGKHRFSSSMEDVAILDADLLPDRIYYAKVSPVMGWWIAQVNMYALHPNCAGNLWPKLPKILKSVRETTLETAGLTAGTPRNMERIESYYREKYLPNPGREQILPEHGQTRPIGAP